MITHEGYIVETDPRTYRGRYLPAAARAAPKDVGFSRFSRYGGGSLVDHCDAQARAVIDLSMDVATWIRAEADSDSWYFMRGVLDAMSYIYYAAVEVFAGDASPARIDRAVDFYYWSLSDVCEKVFVGRQKAGEPLPASEAELLRAYQRGEYVRASVVSEPPTPVASPARVVRAQKLGRIDLIWLVVRASPGAASDSVAADFLNRSPDIGGRYFE